MKLLARHLNILDYALSLLARKKVKNIVILVVYSSVIFLLSSFQLVTTALKESSSKILTAVPDITVQKMSAGRQVPFSINTAESFTGIYGISQIRKRVWGYYFDEKNGANYTVVGMESGNISEHLKLSLKWGRLPEQPEEVVLSRAVAESMQLGGRKRFSLFRPDLSMKSFAVVGEFKEGSALVTGDMMLMPLSDASDLFAMKPFEITDLLIDSANPQEISTVARKISDRLVGSRVITKQQIQKTYEAVFGWRSGVGSVCLLTSLCAFIILAWDKATGLSPDDKRETAILKVIGWQVNDIMMLRFWESAVLALISFLVGYSLAWLHVTLGKGAILKPVLLGWSVLRPPYEFYPPFQFADFLIILTLSVIPYLVATIVPAWKSSMVRPDMVI